MIEVRKLDDGEWCVDLGKKWYRVHADGSVTTKLTIWRKGDLYGSVKARPATKAELLFARAQIAH